MKRVLIDVDGVVADFLTASLNKLTEIGGPTLTKDDIHTWEMRSSIPEEWRQPLLHSWVDPGFCENIPLYPGSQEAIVAIQEIADVVFVTAALSHAPHWMWERTAWLRKHFGVTNRQIIFTEAKHVVVGDVFVDDKYDNIEEWSAAHPKGVPILWHAPSNRSVQPHSKVIRTNDWDHVMQYLRELE